MDGQSFIVEPLFLRIYLTPEGKLKRIEDKQGNLVINVSGIEVLTETIKTEQYPEGLPTGRIGGIRIQLDETITPKDAPHGTRALTHDDLTFTVTDDPVAHIEYRVEREDLRLC